MAKASSDSLQLDAYIKQTIETDFPMLKVAKIVDRQMLGAKLTGIFQDDEQRVFSFYIDKADPRPVLQRF